MPCAWARFEPVRLQRSTSMHGEDRPWFMGEMRPPAGLMRQYTGQPRDRFPRWYLDGIPGVILCKVTYLYIGMYRSMATASEDPTMMLCTCNYQLLHLLH